MKASEIEEILCEFIQDGKNLERAILINGAWGIGKTYHTQKVVEKYHNNKNKKTKVFYTSLFGMVNIDDVRSNVYDMINPGKKVGEKAISVISALTNGIEKLNIIDNIADGIEILTRKNDDQILKRKIKKNVTFIFDDLERVENGFSYISFHGLLNTLQMYGIKVVCICNCQNINESTKESFQEFKEKTFDRVYDIDEPPIEKLVDIFKNFDITESDVVLLNNFFGDNLRIAEKTKVLLTEVIGCLKKNKINYKKRGNDFFLLSSCLFAVKIVLEDTPKTSSETENPTQDVFLSTLIDCTYLSDLKPDSDLRQKFDSFFKANSGKMFVSLSEISCLTGAILRFYTNDRNQPIIDFFNVDPGVDINNVRDIDFMSYKDNEAFSNKYISDIENEVYPLNTQESLYDLQRFLNGTVININDEKIDIIAKNIAESITDLQLIRNNRDNINLTSNQSEKSTFELILDEAGKKFIDNLSNNEIDKISKLFSKKDLYNINLEVSKYLSNESVPEQSKKDLFEWIKQQCYFLPKDFSKTLNRNQWTLCVTIACKISDYPEYKDDYKKRLEKIMNKASDRVSTKRIDLLLTCSKNK